MPIDMRRERVHIEEDALGIVGALRVEFEFAADLDHHASDFVERPERTAVTAATPPANSVRA